jgi:phosphorylase superfamily protein
MAGVSTIMSNFDVLVIAPSEGIAPSGKPEALETPYGVAQLWRQQLGALRSAWVATGTSPFAAIYAAKAAGARRVVELAPVAARNRLLESGDLLLPDDLLDRTQLPRYTFFAGKGYGFLSQREPFCPALREALLASASERSPRVFARGVYLAAQPPAAEHTHVWDADIVGSGVVPASFLSRELELCYAPLCIVVDEARSPAESRIVAGAGNWAALAEMLVEALGRLPAERDCGCATAMRQYRDRGDIGPDWRTWIST